VQSNLLGHGEGLPSRAPQFQLAGLAQLATMVPSGGLPTRSHGIAKGRISCRAVPHGVELELRAFARQQPRRQASPGW